MTGKTRCSHRPETACAGDPGGAVGHGTSSARTRRSSARSRARPCTSGPPGGRPRRPAQPAAGHRVLQERRRIMAAITAILEEIAARRRPRSGSTSAIAGEQDRRGRRPLMRVAVMGSGSWGTAFAMVLADAGNEVVVWGARRRLAEAMTTGENPRGTSRAWSSRTRCGHHRPAEALDGGSSCSPCRPIAARQPRRAGTASCRATHLVSLMKGIEQGRRCG